MKNKLSKVLIILILMLSFSSCSNRNYKVASNNNSKVIATVGDVNITKQQLESRKMDSTYSAQEKVFSDKKGLDDIIDERLLLIKAKELNIKMSDNEVKESYKEMRMQMSSIQYVKGDEEKISKDTIEGLRDTFILQKTKDKLGSDIDKTLELLKKTVKIQYYN